MEKNITSVVKQYIMDPANTRRVSIAARGKTGACFDAHFSHLGTITSISKYPSAPWFLYMVTTSEVSFEL